MKNKAIIFARVSTDEQDYERQLHDLKKYALLHELQVVGAISEKIRGGKLNKERKGVKELLERARNGEFQYVIAQDVPRLGRNTFQVQSLIHELAQLKICVLIQHGNLRSLNEHGEPDELMGLILDVSARFAAMANKERNSQIKSGIAQAKRRGVKVGRPLGVKEDDAQLVTKWRKKNNALIVDLRDGLSQKKAAKLHKLSINTIRKIKAALIRQQEQNQEKLKVA